MKGEGGGMGTIMIGTEGGGEAKKGGGGEIHGKGGEGREVTGGGGH